MFFRNFSAGLVAGVMTVATLAAMPAAQAEDSPGMLGDYQPSGFLSSYAKLVPNPDLEHSYIYRYPGKDAAKYKRVIIDPIEIRFSDSEGGKDAAGQPIDPADLQKLKDYFHEALVKALGDAYPVVTEPAPDVIRLRIALTNLHANKPLASVATLVVPFLWVADAGTGVVDGEAGSTMFVGEASMELEVLDSVSKQQLAALVETNVAKKYNWTEGVKEGVTDYLRSYSTWAYTKEAMDHWANKLRERMDMVHGKPPVKKSRSIW